MRDSSAVRDPEAPSTGHPLTTVATEPEIGVAWLWKLRWAALAGLGPMLIIARALGLPLDARALGSMALASALSNLLLKLWIRRRRASNGVILVVLLGDVALLTAVLGFSGAAANPFSALYIVHVAVASLLLGPLSALVLTALTSLCFGILLLAPEAHVGMHAHLGSGFPEHLRGMWVAYVLSAAFVAYFVSRIAGALRAREAEMASLRRYAAGMERVASLATMATGAAHELGSPLASIAVSASELSDALSADASWAPFAMEARHIREEVTRCRAILDRLARGAGQHAGEAPEVIEIEAMIERLRHELGSVDAALLDVDCQAEEGTSLRSPPVALIQSLTSLIRNGIDAGRLNGSEARVQLRISTHDGCAVFDVLDRGAGLPSAMAGRIGEPFSSTKPVGTGMGLGVYLVKTFAQQVGGQLSYEQLPSGGTRARLRLGHGSTPAPEVA
jgi:two-component system sensor histidine kinase RegB